MSTKPRGGVDAVGRHSGLNGANVSWRNLVSAAHIRKDGRSEGLGAATCSYHRVLLSSNLETQYLAIVSMVCWRIRLSRESLGNVKTHVKDRVRLAGLRT